MDSGYGQTEGIDEQRGNSSLSTGEAIFNLDGLKLTKRVCRADMQHT